MDEREMTMPELLAPPHAAHNHSADGSFPTVRGGARLLAPRVQRALGVLLESYDYAQDVGCDVWEFAVEMDHLRPFGLTASDWRWLHLKGFIGHGRELTIPGEASRTFRQGGALKIGKRTCFVLTEAGQQYARTLAAAAATSTDSPAAWPPAPRHDDRSEAHLLEAKVSPTILPAVLPTWDRDRQQLRVGKIIVKEFKVPAPNQEAILAVFQEENWPPRIDDPLSPEPDVEPKRRLHDTITSLNRNQKEPLIRFLGDGSGQGARWEYIRPAEGNGREGNGRH